MPQTVFAITFTLPEINLLLDALTVYTAQEIDDPRHYTPLRHLAKPRMPSDLANIADAQHASLALLLRVKQETERRGSL